jgi:hypothetical protein
MKRFLNISKKKIPNFLHKILFFEKKKKKQLLVSKIIAKVLSYMTCMSHESLIAS